MAQGIARPKSAKASASNATRRSRSLRARAGSGTRKDPERTRKSTSGREDRNGDSATAVEALEGRREMKREQLYLFQEYTWEETDGVHGDGLSEDEEV